MNIYQPNKEMSVDEAIYKISGPLNNETIYATQTCKKGGSRYGF